MLVVVVFRLAQAAADARLSAGGRRDRARTRSAGSRTPESTRGLAEFGVVFLMFSIGLEFSLPQLITMRRIVFGLGAAQVVLTLCRSSSRHGAAPVSTGASGVVLGGVLAMSSTAIVSKMLAERLELNSLHGTADHRRTAVPGPRGGAAADPDPGAGAAGRRIWRRNLALALLKAAVVLAMTALLRAAADARLVSPGGHGKNRPNCSC